MCVTICVGTLCYSFSFINQTDYKETIIYSSMVLCLCVCECVCVSQFVSERSAILLVLSIKLTIRRRDGGFGEGGIKDGEIGKRQIVEGGCEETFHWLSHT